MRSSHVVSKQATEDTCVGLVQVQADLRNHLKDYGEVKHKLDENTKLTIETDKKLDTVLYILNNGLSDKISVKVTEALEQGNKRKWMVFGTLGGGGVIVSILVLVLNLTGVV